MGSKCKCYLVSKQGKKTKKHVLKTEKTGRFGLLMAVMQY